MGLRTTIINALGGVDKSENAYQRSTPVTDFLKYGNRNQPLLPDWSDVKMSDEDLYRGYSYAVIQKRGNKVATLARENLRTDAAPEVVDKFQDNDKVVIHPYLSVIQNSTQFTEKQFWKNISIYLDLAGRYYLGVVRKVVRASNPNLPDIVTGVKEFIMLNPYEIRRVINKDGELAGYIERKKDGRYREWPIEQIIAMKELNPFDPENSQWAMTDAAKDAVYTINQSSDYTRHSMHGNLDAPGIITTDVILDDADFANFQARVREHRKGEPLFGNGAGAINWESMQIDLDKAALLDINEINRTTLFAVSGTSKTSLGIEQSGTTRETARVQSEQFISDTAQPRLEDIIDFLNLDYRKYYKDDYRKNRYSLEVKSAVGRDYSTELQATETRQSQSALALELIQAGYTMESSYQYAEGNIELSDLELEKGLDKPKSPNDGQQGAPSDENSPNSPQNSPQGGSSGEDDDNTKSEENSLKTADNDVQDTNVSNVDTLTATDLTPHSDLVGDTYAEEGKQDSPLTNDHHDGCTCSECNGGIETYHNDITAQDVKVLDESYDKLLEEIRGVQKDAINSAVDKLTINAFAEDDIISDKDKGTLTERLVNAFRNYWWLLLPMFANNLTNRRNREFKQDRSFVFTNEIQQNVVANAESVAESHLATILNDILDASNKAYTRVVEKVAAQLIIEAYKKNPARFEQYFKKEPTERRAIAAIRNTDILEENQRLYQRANDMALEGYDRQSIIKQIRAEYTHLSKTRATTIAQNETSRAFTQSQYQADLQFLKGINRLDDAYKQLYSRTGNPCKYCQALIDKGPIPFTQNFLDKGESLQVTENGKTSTMVANYENIAAGVVHVNCKCQYRLVFKGKDGRITSDYNSIWGESNDTSANNSGRWLSSHSNYESEEVNSAGVTDARGHVHAPAGTPEGGQFVKKEGGGNETPRTGVELLGSDVKDKLGGFNKLSLDEQAVFLNKAAELEDLPDDISTGMLNRITYALGINNKPTVVSEEKFDALISDGARPMYRVVGGNEEMGITSKQVANQLAYGEHTYQGNGSLADGTYFAQNSEEIKKYAEGKADVTKITATLSGKAKIASRKDEKKLNELVSSWRKAGATVDRKTLRSLAALCLGFDGHEVGTLFGNGEPYICLYKRDNLVIRRFSDE